MSFSDVRAASRCEKRTTGLLVGEGATNAGMPTVAGQERSGAYTRDLPPENSTEDGRGPATTRTHTGSMFVECSVGGCDNKARARGWCKKHHTRWMRHGDPTVVLQGGPQARKAECSVDGCDRLRHARGMCHRHYSQVVYEPVPGKPAGVWDNTACFDCGAPPVCGGKWCRTCWDARRPSAQPHSGKERVDPGRTPVVQARFGAQAGRWVA